MHSYLTTIVLLEIWGTLKKLGGLGLILMGLIDSSVIPTPGGLDVLTVLLAAGEKTWWPYYAVMATTGSVLGGYLTYKLGRKGGEEALEQRLSKRKFKKIYRIFEKWGFGAVFVPALLPPPVPLGPFLLGAGAMDYPLKKFLAALCLGRLIRFSIVAYLASLYGKKVLGFFAENYKPVLITFVILIAVGIIGFLIYRKRQKSLGSSGNQRAEVREDAA